MSARQKRVPVTGEFGSLMPARICLLLAVCGAGYLAAVSLSGGAVAGCGPESGCNHVLGSRWAYWLGIPVSLPALGVYLALFVATLATGKTRPEAGRRQAWRVIATLSPLIIAAALWFVGLQYAVIKSWCKFCLGTHACAMLGAVLLLRQLPGGFLLREKSEPRAGWAARLLRHSRAGAILGLAVLITGQVAVKKRLYLVTSNPTPALGHPARQIRLYEGQFSLNPDELPLLGSPAATNFIVGLFDYTCSHCRHLHPLLRLAEDKYAGRFGIISLPMPLDAACNPHIRRTNPANTNACEYAKFGLAVWHAQPKAFREFDDWLFTSNAPPPLVAVRAKAEALMGGGTLDRALNDPWVARQLKTDIDLYVANAQPPGDGRLPQLMFSDIIARGSIESQAELERLIDQHVPFGGEGPARTNAAAQ